MQQYKFRGKRKDNGEWAYGSYVSTPALPLADSKHLIFEFTGIESGEPIFDVHEVIPETVGMWTGLKDKNGKEVWEGDIYLAERSYMSSRGYKRVGYPDRITVICVVEWWKYSAGWHGKEVSAIKEHIEYDKNAPYHYIHTSLEGSTTGSANWIEVIGNITDHPHLLNPAKGAVINTMSNIDPNEKQSEEVKAEGQEIAAVEQEAQEKAMESAEEGGTEG